MSFSGNVKKELSEINIFSNTGVMKYELYGYMLTITRIGELVRNERKDIRGYVSQQ